MKNKGILSLIELTVMLAVFALAAALCLQAFTQADRISRRGEARDRAVSAAQNVAEVLQGSAGNTEALAGHLDGTGTADGWQILYDIAWEPVQENGAYLLTVTMSETGGRAEIQVACADGEVLLAFPVGWQEVTS